MLLLKACPRCGGDMYRERDLYGSYASCLNCGYLLDVQDHTQDQERSKVFAGSKPEEEAA